jgi:hypothetical protein
VFSYYSEMTLSRVADTVSGMAGWELQLGFFRSSESELLRKDLN